MIYFIAYMLIGLAVDVWGLSGADTQCMLMELRQFSEIEEPWCFAVLVAVGIIAAALLWPILLAVFIKILLTN